MPKTLTIVLDSPATAAYHAATLTAVGHAVEAARADLDVRVVRTPEITEALLARPGDGVLIGPGSPYDAPLRAEELIRSARERGLPLLAT